MYYRHSIKGFTRKSRNTSGARFIFDGDAELPCDFMTFCRTKTFHPSLSSLSKSGRATTLVARWVVSNIS